MFVFCCLLLVVVSIKLQTKVKRQERLTTRKEEERARREHIYQKKNKKHKDSPCHTKTIERQDIVWNITQQERREDKSETRQREDE